MADRSEIREDAEGGAGWRTDLSNAPRDGTPILAWIPTEDYTDFKGYSIVWWENNSWTREADYYNLVTDEPTAWMPLPAPPTTTSHSPHPSA